MNYPNKKKAYYIFIFIILSSLSFYNPLGLISSQLSKLISYIVFLVGLMFAIRKGVSLKSLKYPRVTYRVLLIGIIFSTFMPMFFHDQSLSVTVIATLPYLTGYSVFYILMKLDIPKEKILHAIFIFCFLGMGFYIINMLTFPNLIFGADREEYDMSRGVVRIGIHSFSFIVLIFFYAINQWINKNKIKYLLLIFLTAFFIVLSVTRQAIIFSFILGLLLILSHASLSKKIVTISFCIIFYAEILPQIPIYKNMVELSETQAERNKFVDDDVRIKAWRFYIYEYQTNVITPLFGNGLPVLGKSKWGHEFEKTTSYDYGGNLCYFVDVGWAGFYWLFGALTTSGLVILLLKAVFKKKSISEQYLSYWCLFILLTSFASAPILFYSQIVNIVTVLYLIYGKKSYNSSNNFKLQQL